MAFVGDGGGGGGGGGWRRCGSEKKKHGLALLMTWKKKVGCASVVVGALECAGMMMMSRSWCYTGLCGQTVRTARRRRPSPNGHRQSGRSVWGVLCGERR